MEQGDAEILERITAGERVFRPGAPTEQARRMFESLVGQPRELALFRRGERRGGERRGGDRRR